MEPETKEMETVDISKSDVDKAIDDLREQGFKVPSMEQIKQWRMQYGSVFMTFFNDYDVWAWRGVTRGEWKNIVKNMSDDMTQLDMEDAICERIMLFPNSLIISSAPAGRPSLIYMEFSRFMGFTDNAMTYKV